MHQKIVLILLLFSCPALAQNVFKDKNGKASFFSDALLEDIEAVSNKASAAFNIKTGEVAALIPVSSFKFDNELMQQHFNENYLESSRFPNAIFKGKIIEKVIGEPGSKQLLNVAGELTIHGVTKPATIPVNLVYKNDGTIQATSKWMVKLEDYKIKIPQLVFQNIAEQVEVSMDFNLSSPDEK